VATLLRRRKPSISFVFRAGHSQPQGLEDSPDGHRNTISRFLPVEGETNMSTKNYTFGISQFTTNPWSFEQDVEAYSRLGVQAIEICESKLSAEHRSSQLDLLPQSGLQVSSVQPAVRTLFPSNSQPEPVDVADRISLFRQSIVSMSPWTPGASFVANTGIPPAGNIKAAIDRAVTEYRTLSDFAANHGVSIALEPLNPTIMNVESAIWTLAQALDIVESVDRRNFGVCLDCWNVWQNPDLDQQIQRAADRILVVQISDWRTPRSFQDRLIPGQGIIPLASFIKSVRRSGFTGSYSVEIFSAGVPDALWEKNLEEVILESKNGLAAAWEKSFE
jgi:sugar phosphate isomerase/epimerase